MDEAAVLLGWVWPLWLRGAVDGVGFGAENRPLSVS